MTWTLIVYEKDRLPFFKLFPSFTACEEYRLKNFPINYDVHLSSVFDFPRGNEYGMSVARWYRKDKYGGSELYMTSFPTEVPNGPILPS